MNRFVFLCWMPLLILSGCSLNKDDRLSLPRDQVFIVGLNATFPPYESVNEQGCVEGFDVDVARELGDRLHKELVIKEMSFDALILSLKHNRIDAIISGMSMTPSRLKEIDMVPYQGESIGHLLVICKDAVACDPQDFSQYASVAVQAGTFQEEYLLSLGNVCVRSFDSVAELVMEVRYNKSPVAVFEPSVGKITVEEFREFKYYLVPLPEDQKVLGYGIGIAPANKDLYHQVAESIQEMKADGTIARLERKWRLRKE